MVPYLFQETKTIFVRFDQVQDDQIGLFVPGLLQGLGAVLGDQDRMAFLHQAIFEDCTYVYVAAGDEDFSYHSPPPWFHTN